MKNLIEINDICEIIDTILVERGLLNKGEYFADETISYKEEFLAPSCNYEEIDSEDGIFLSKEKVISIMDNYSDNRLREIIAEWKD